MAAIIILEAILPFADLPGPQIAAPAYFLAHTSFDYKGLDQHSQEQTLGPM